ncbi:MAG: hypothetical protein OD918_07955 [Gammaproteobacteria bacterium]
MPILAMWALQVTRINDRAAARAGPGMVRLQRCLTPKSIAVTGGDEAAHVARDVAAAGIVSKHHANSCNADIANGAHE